MVLRGALMVGWVATALSASCVRNVRDTERLYVRGKVYRCPDPNRSIIEPPATGQTISLVVHGQVIASDVVNPDGSFVLHPRESVPFTGLAWVETGKKRVALTNDYASWLQDHIVYEMVVRPDCSLSAPANGPTTEGAQPIPAGITPEMP